MVERHHIDWRVIAWALPARVPGTLLGVWLVTAIAGRWLGVAVAVMVGVVFMNMPEKLSGFCTDSVTKTA